MIRKVFQGLFGKGKSSAVEQQVPVAQPLAGKTEAPPQKPAPVAQPDRPKTPDELCGIDPGMPIEVIKEKLSTLYKRYNRAAASIDVAMQKEADVMLDAIVDCRHKYLGE